jgi:hypothetical protein
MRLSVLSFSLSLSLSLRCFVVDASIDALQAVDRTLGRARIFKSAGQAKAAEALSRSTMPGNDLPLFRRPE